MARPAEGRSRGAPGPPDFIGVGTPGDGTAWWRKLLFAHPEIRPPKTHRRGGVDFFRDFATAEMTQAHEAAYHALFRRVPGKICGEWTGRYMLDAWTVPLLARVAPEARLIVMVGDPIIRYRVVVATRHRSFAPTRTYRTTDIAERLCHASQLARLHRFFDPDRILVLQYERCLRDRAGQYRRTLQFLGVRDLGHLPARRRHRPPPTRLSQQAARVARLGLPGRAARRAAELVVREPLGRAELPLWPGLEASLHTALDPEIERLAELVPDLDLTLWPSFAHLAGERRSAALDNPV